MVYVVWKDLFSLIVPLVMKRNHDTIASITSIDDDDDDDDDDGGGGDDDDGDVDNDNGPV